MHSSFKLYRVLLVVFGCLPMIALHITLSLGVFLFALPAVFLGGHTGNIVFVLWWLLGTYGLIALVYSCATFRTEAGRLARWQQTGLVLGVVLSVPVAVFGFTHGAGILAVVLGSVAAIIVFVTDRHYELADSEDPNRRT